MLDSVEAVAVFLFFLPGIVGAILFLGIAELDEPGAWQVTTLAVALSLVAAVLCDAYFGIPIAGTTSFTVDAANLGKLIDSYTGRDALVRTGVASVLAVIAAIAHNKAWLYKAAYRAGLTRRTGAIDVWHQAFRAYNNKWVRVRFSDGSKAIGWVRWYAENGEKKELFLGEATWYLATKDDDSVRIDKVDVKGPGIFIANFDEVLGIDFID